MKREASRQAVSVPRKAPVDYWPSHIPFADMISYCTRGVSHPVLRSAHVSDHIAETVELHLDDVESLLWDRNSKDEGPVARELLQKLEDRVFRDNDLHAAELLYAIATEAAYGVLDLYLRKRELFDRIAPRRKFLPSLFSIHPDTAKVTDQMFEDSQLGTQTDHARQAGSRAYFVSDSPANVYARAVIASVSFNRELEPVSCQQRGWEEFDRKEGVQTVVLPFPKYVAGLDRLPIPITPESVMQYWRKGKEIILEEMPDFHLRPEWKDYHQRRYRAGAKPGAIRHAIFKDILIALKTIAGANKRESAIRNPKP